MKRTILFFIKLYQKTISPDHGAFPVLRLLGQCRHSPTCSEYAKRAIKKDGIIKGMWRGIKRIATCH